MHRSQRPMTVLLLVLLLALPGCGVFGSNPNAAPTLIATGETLDLVKGQFVTIAGVMNGLYDAKVISTAQYDPWRKFVPRFQAVYPLTVQAWQAAKRVCAPPAPAVLDATSCTSQSEAVRTQASALAAELAGLAGQAYLMVAASPSAPVPAAVRAK